MSPFSLANEEPASIQGTISIDVADFSDHVKMKYTVKDNKGKRTEIALDKQPAWLANGQKVRVRGQHKNGKFVSSEGEIDLLESTTSTTSTSGTTSTSANAVSGQRSVLAVEVHGPLYDVVANTEERIQDILFNQTNQYYQEASYGKVSITGDVAQPVVVDYNTDSCDTYDLTDKVDQALRRQGYEPDNYDHVAYLIPYYSACRWNGKANVGGPRMWIKRFEVSTVKHEMGHNLGLYHANKKECGTATTNSSNCTTIEYGDTYSGMSNSTHPYHFNGFHKEQLGWLDGQIATLTSDGSARIAPLEVKSDSPKVLKILKNTDENGQSEWYYIEYRKALGFDSALSINQAHELSGVRLREGKDNIRSSSYLLDPTPESSNLDWLDITIYPGQSYIDEQYGVTITVTDSDDSGVTVAAAFNNGNTGRCTTSAPKLAAMSGNASAIAGEEVTLQYQITNNDSVDCSSDTFNLAGSVPSGWTVAMSDTQLTLAPGQTQSLELYTTVASSQTDGNYTVTANAQRTNGSDQVSVSNQVAVSSDSVGGGDKAPTAVNDAVSISSKDPVTINVLSNDSDPEGASLQIVSVSQGSKGSVTINAGGTVTYSPAKSFKSSDSFTYTITDGTNKATATVSITLQGNSTGGGGNGGGKGKNR
ncbi:Ig-like domain-containing protein [Vibrio sp.]|uniref:Ig-like domain-containing protein n=1 Tax=Vibrio sp. TaxID=678 RepID=UPI003D0EE5A0